MSADVGAGPDRQVQTVPGGAAAAGGHRRHQRDQQSAGVDRIVLPERAAHHRKLGDRAARLPRRAVQALAARSPHLRGQYHLGPGRPEDPGHRREVHHVGLRHGAGEVRVTSSPGSSTATSARRAERDGVAELELRLDAGRRRRLLSGSVAPAFNLSNEAGLCGSTRTTSGPGRSEFFGPRLACTSSWTARPAAHALRQARVHAELRGTCRGRLPAQHRRGGPPGGVEGLFAELATSSATTRLRPPVAGAADAALHPGRGLELSDRGRLLGKPSTAYIMPSVTGFGSPHWPNHRR